MHVKEYDRKNSRKNWWIVDDSTYKLAQFSTVNGWFGVWFLLLRFFLWIELPDLVYWPCGVFIKCQLYEYSFGECPNYLDGNILTCRLLRSGADLVFLYFFSNNNKKWSKKAKLCEWLFSLIISPAAKIKPGLIWRLVVRIFSSKRFWQDFCFTLS